MTDPTQREMDVEIARLRTALEAETRRSIELERKLDRAGAEVDEFVSIAAHNLRESLRDVTTFSQLLAETCAGHMSSETGRYLDRIQNGAARMQALLADIVDYWALGAGDRPQSRVDMEGALRQVLLLMDNRLSERGAVITHDPLPAVMGDMGVLTKVMGHVIGNAIEYCGAPSPAVHVSSRRDGLDWILSVRDNGAGVDPACQERVFGVFQRLHGKERPGSGLGLAFCRKAVERLGGRIWMESAPGAGSVVYLALPADD
jgi:light-regulated signal transduction histidine kinase (bacteriophytochrome)